jgi:hypothetical protein
MPSLPVAATTLAVLLGLSLGGCNAPTDAEHQRVIGTIDPGSSSAPALEVPGEVRAKTPFAVVVHTLGSSDCTKPDGESLVVRDDLARVVPYDIVPMPGHTDVCQHDYVGHRHQLSVTFPHSGTARVRLVGMSPSRAGVLDSVEAVVTVGP